MRHAADVGSEAARDPVDDPVARRLEHRSPCFGRDRCGSDDWRRVRRHRAAPEAAPLPVGPRWRWRQSDVGSLKSERQKSEASRYCQTSELQTYRVGHRGSAKVPAFAHDTRVCATARRAFERRVGTRRPSSARSACRCWCSGGSGGSSRSASGRSAAMSIDAMRERGRGRTTMPRRLQQLQVGVEPDLAERDDDADAGQRVELGFEMRQAVARSPPASACCRAARSGRRRR